MDRNRDESRICKDSEEEDSAVKHFRPTIIGEIGHIFITGDGKKFINEKEAKTHQEKIMEVFKEANKLTNKQKKKKVIDFLQINVYASFFIPLFNPTNKLISYYISIISIFFTNLFNLTILF